MEESRLKAWHAETARTIRENGCSIVAVCASSDGERFAPFAYSIGMTDENVHPEWWGPEIYVSGLPAQVAGPTINLSRDLAQRGNALAHGQIVAGILVNGVPLAAIELHMPEDLEEAETFAIRSFYGDEIFAEQSFQAIQIFWPDSKGRFP